jgi:hypothetical protein
VHEEDGVRSARSERTSNPADEERPISCADVCEWTEQLDRSALYWIREREHSAGAPEANRWVRHDLPTVDRDAHRSPLSIREIEIDVAFVLSEAKVHLVLVTIEERQSFENAESIR